MVKILDLIMKSVRWRHGLAKTNQPRDFLLPSYIGRDQSDHYYRRLFAGLTPSQIEAMRITWYSLFVMSVCLFSIILCTRTLCRGQLLAYKIREHFMTKYSVRLTMAENLQFVNWMYVVIVINDLLIIFR